MTRENKLALVIGFALFLLVGILISDHFSTARSQESAEFTGAIDTISDSRLNQPDLIAINPSELPAAEQSGVEGGALSYDEPAVRVVDPVLQNRQPGIEMGGSTGGRVNLNPAQAEALPYTYHQVRENETLTAICNHYYGDISLIEELAAANGISNPNDVRAGHRLRIPGAETLVRDRPVAAPAAAAAPQTDRTYTVRDGDSLSEIARRFLGSANRYDAIFEHNRDVLSSPDDLKPGMKLKIPRRAG